MWLACIWLAAALAPRDASEPVFGRDGSVTVHADASVYTGLFSIGENLDQPLDPARIAYVHLVRGRLRVNGQMLHGGDAVRLDQETHL